VEITLSFGQMDVKRGDVATNMSAARELVAEAARRGSGLLLLPELWSTGYDLQHADQYATPLGEGLFAEIASLACTHGIDIVGSTLTTMDGGGIGNTAVYIDRRGERLGAYHKIHLFGPMEEITYLKAGDSPTIVETGCGGMGLAICYDLRFPELFRAYAAGGALVVLVVAEWPRPRLAHWRTLLRARAIENQFFVAACNRVGRTRSTEFFGHSTLLDPCGEIIVEAGDQPQLLTATIDLDQVAAVRAGMPVLADRRPDAYDLRRES
jgi:omega-amidase